MTQEIRDVLYNKQEDELNKQDFKYIDKLICKDGNDFFIKETLILTPAIFFIMPLILGLCGLIIINPIVLGILTATGFIIGGLLGGTLNVKNYSLKELGLTRKEWKELKKSGRLKELEQIVKEYDKSLKSELDYLYERETEITAKINEKEEEKQTLIDELVELRDKHKSISKTPTYTQEEVAEMLKIEENLLMRRLEMLKKEQSTLQESSDSKVLNETGKKSEQNIDYMQQALKNCQEFNEEFKGETFDI